MCGSDCKVPGAGRRAVWHGAGGVNAAAMRQLLVCQIRCEGGGQMRLKGVTGYAVGCGRDRAALHTCTHMSVGCVRDRVGGGKLSAHHQN